MSRAIQNKLRGALLSREYNGGFSELQCAQVKNLLVQNLEIERKELPKEMKTAQKEDYMDWQIELHYSLCRESIELSGQTFSCPNKCVRCSTSIQDHMSSESCSWYPGSPCPCRICGEHTKYRYSIGRDCEFIRKQGYKKLEPELQRHGMLL